MPIEIRRVAAARGFTWFTRSLELAGKRPGVVLGALGWQLLLLFAAFLILTFIVSMALTTTGANTAGDNTIIVIVLVLGTFLLIALYQPLMYAGILHVLRKIADKQPVRARDVFVTFAGGRVGALASLGLVQVAATALNVGAMYALGGEQYLRDYVAFLQAALHGQSLSEPVTEHALLISLVQIVVSYFAWSAQVYAAALIQFEGAQAWPAVLASLRAASINVLPLTLAGLLLALGLIAGWIVGILLIVLLGMLLAALAKLLSSLVTIALVALLLGATFALMFSGVLLSWRDMFVTGTNERKAKPPVITAEL